MKFFSFYLPQFHQIPENDKWWGNGFTEWDKVRKASPLYKGHEQPVIPFGNNYYNLLKKETFEWQTNLMREYKIYGMVYYHYYFQGKLLLEKPSENLLGWKDIEQPFFFCWANHSWRRSWEGSQEILLEQTYGESIDWEKHFQYLLPFFRDSRYEKKDSCPLFMIYDPFFPEKENMMRFFDRRCRENGFNGIWLIECSHGQAFQIEKLKREKPVEHYCILLREPEYSKIKYYEEERDKAILYKHAIQKRIDKLVNPERSQITRFDNNDLFNVKLRHYKHDDSLMQCICFSWDNTPRHGKRGYIIEEVDKRHFFRYMDKIMEEEYCFINAWNEWSEGMILEPTVQHGYRYLEWIKEWMDNNN